MLIQRIASAVIGIPIILGLIALGGTAFSIAIGFILAIAVFEYFATIAGASEARLRTDSGLPSFLPRDPTAYLFAAVVGLVVAGAHNGVDWWTGALALAVFLSLTSFVLAPNGRSAVRWSWGLTAVVYIGYLGSHLVLLRDMGDGRDWTMLAVFGVFITDTSAYFVGRAIGRRKLAPSISPGKTVQGTAAGLALGAAGVIFLNWVSGLRIGPAEIAGLAILLPLLAVIGDLGESLLKRSAGVKDVSGLVPGHGGFLDRLDSQLFAIPLVYYYALWVA